MGKTKNKSETDENNSSDHGSDCDQGAPPQENQNTQEVEANDVDNLSENRKDLTSATSTTAIIISEDETQKGEVAAEAHEGALGSGYNNGIGNGTGLSNSHFPGNDNKGDKVDSSDSFISSTKIRLVNPSKPEKIIVNGGNDTQIIATTKTTEIGAAGPGEHTKTESKSVIISLSEDPPPPPPSRKCECECQRTDSNFLEANKIKNHLSHLGRRHSYGSYGKKKGAINFGYVPNEADVAELEFQRQLLHQLQLQFQLQTAAGGGQVSESDLKPTPASVAVTAPLSSVVEITPEMGLPKSKFTQNPCTTVDDSGRESNCSHSANSSINELTLRSRDPDHGHNHHDDHECSEDELEEDDHHLDDDDDHHHHRLRSSLHSSDTHRHMDRMVSMRKEFVRENARRCLIKSIRFRFTETDSERIREDVFVKICSNGELLGKLFCLFDFEQTNVLQQDEWIEFLKARLNGEEKQIDFVEVVESVTYALCRDSDVNFEQFCAIFRTKNVLNKFFRLIDRDLDGIVTADQVMEFISQLSSARSNSRLTKENIKWLERLFRQYVGEGNEIRKEDFNKIIQTKNQFFTERVFEIFDRDSSGSISLQEFLDCMHQFTGQNPDDKIHFLFKVYDVDGDGLIQEAELEQVMTACMEENGMKFSDEQIHELTIALFEDADVEKRGALTYEALKAQLEKHTGLLENLSISIERWLVPPKPRETDQSLLGKIRSWKPHQLSPRYFRNNYVYLLWLFAFLITNAALFFYRIFNWRYRDGTYDDESTHYLVVARAAGQCLNFDCTFIVVVMLRQTLTFLRARGASTFLPIDQHIYFHKMTGWFIFVFSLLHTVAHLVNISEGIIANSANTTSYIAILFDPNATTSYGLIHGYGFNTGFFLMIILTVMVICSLPFVRRGGCFEVFYWTHTLYLLFWILLIVHAPNFWKWFVVPGIIFIVEQALRYYHWRVGRGRTYILSGILLPSKVTHISIRRPSNFEFRPGDYVFVRIPQIATYEWHPFTISSAPEQDGMISLHIRAVGQWTNRLYEYFDQEQTKLRAGTGEEMCLSPKAQSFTPTIRIGDKLALLNSSDINTAAVPNNAVQLQLNSLPTVTSTYTEPPENLVKRVAFQDHANRLKSVGDSVSTMMPSSSESDSLNNSNNDITSSAETMSDLEAIVKSKKVPIRLHKPKLESTKSMPNVHERMVDRERKLIVRHNPVVQRSISVQSVENDSNKSGGNLSHANGSSNPVVPTSRTKMSADSLRYMRNRPTVISLKTPEFNYDVDDDGDNNHIIGLPIGVGLGAASGGNNNADRLAEEGISPLGGVHVDDITDVNNSVVVTSAQKKAVQRQWSSFQIMGTTDDDMVVGRPLEIYVDGPYGAPSSHIFRAQHAVLIATGIGVTPFASILQSIMLRYWTSRLTCPNCNFTWCGDMPQSVFNLKKVDFLWINREQRSFEWFVHLLSQLEIEQAELGGAMERFLDMHMYITSALQRTDMKAVGLQLALDLLHEKEKRDLITGLKTRTNAGRPNWNKLFKQLQDQNKGKITVFYCGPPTLARTLKVKCDEFGFSFRKELF